MNDDAIAITAQELNLTSTAVQDALAIYRVYAKHQQRAKQSRLAQRAAARGAAELAKQMAAYPNRCFCVERGLDPQHTFEHNAIAGYRSGVRTNWYNGKTETYQYAYWSCELCNKEYWLTVAIA